MVASDETRVVTANLVHHSLASWECSTVQAHPGDMLVPARPFAQVIGPGSSMTLLLLLDERIKLQAGLNSLASL